MNEHIKGKIGEDAVNEVAEKTYLKYWCYPSPKDEKGNKKEICDLLILFRESAVIISVKNYEFKGNYERYFRSTLKKAISQVDGAERKLFNSNRQISFNHPTKGELSFDPENYRNIQRIIINLSTVPLFYPGGTLSPKNNFIHIFNWFAFLKSVEELNTIPDFIQYLVEREKAFSKKQIVMLTGEENDWTSDSKDEFDQYMSTFDPTVLPIVLFSGNELDLLAAYLFGDRKFNYPLNSNEYDGASVEYDGQWKEYIERKEVQRKKEEDQISYFIDELVEREVLLFDDDLRIDIATELLSLSRFQRRIIGRHFHSFITKYYPISDLEMARRYGVINDIAIAFFMHGNGVTQDMAMTMMNIAVQGFSHWEGYKTKKILMIGCNSELTQFKFAYNPKVEKLPEKEEEDLIHDLKILNWFENIEQIDFNFKEYPSD